MSEYQASITYNQTRHFSLGEDGNVIASGEMLRLGDTIIVAYIRPEATLETKAETPFEGRILFLSKLEESHPFSAGQKLEIVEPSTGTMRVVGYCVVRNKVC